MAETDKAEDGALHQLLAVLDRLPFVSGIKRDATSLRQLLYQRRVPRLCAIGRGGSGRTRLINALLGKEAIPDDTPIEHDRWVRIDADGPRVDWLELDLGAPEQTLEVARAAFSEAQPDCVLWLLRPADLDDDLAPLVETLRKVLSEAAGAGDHEPKLLALLSRADDVKPGDGWDDDRLTKVDLHRQKIEAALEKGDEPLSAEAVLAVASPPDGTSLHLNELTTVLLEALPDAARIEAARTLARAGDARRKLANRIVRSCSTIALTVGMAPVPLSDAFIIAPLQVMMVSAVAHLGGRPWNRKAAVEWMASMGVVGGAGMGLRWTAQQLVKLVPGAGYLVSAGVAGAGTVTLGQSAIAYFLREDPTRQIPEDFAVPA